MKRSGEKFIQDDYTLTLEPQARQFIYKPDYGRVEIIENGAFHDASADLRADSTNWPAAFDADGTMGFHD